MTQQDTILHHLRTHKKGLTSKEANDRYGCTRLAAVVGNLRRKGYRITAERECVVGRYGKVSITRYHWGA